MVRDALWLERKICKDFKCSFFSSKAYISFTWRDGISENTYKQTEMRWYFQFRSPDWALSVLTGEAQLVMPTGTRWKLWTYPIYTVGKRASQELLRYGRSRWTCATGLAVSVQPWSWVVSKVSLSGDMVKNLVPCCQRKQGQALPHLSSSEFWS